MLALSIRQPWAWSIIHAGKDIENRSWATTVRGRVLVHAAQGMTKLEYHDAAAFILHGCGGVAVPPLATLQRGGIIGSVEIVDCVTASDSPWFLGRHGFVLRNPIAMPFTPWKGRLGFFDIPDHALRAV